MRKTDHLPIIDGMAVNAITADDLFARYRRLKFLYPAKFQALAPFLSTVLNNWQQGLNGGSELFRVLTAEKGHAWASITSWRTTTHGWHSQHLVSNGNPAASCEVMLSEQHAWIQNPHDHSGQNWFQPSNRYASRVFATAAKAIGQDYASLETYTYLAMSLKAIGQAHGAIGIHSGLNRSKELFHLAQKIRGAVYARAEEFDQDDVGLEALDQRYRKLGLRRYRRVWLATLPRFQEPVGAVIAYRGPLGFNFSFLENRCDLLVQQGLTIKEERLVLLHLLQAAASAYQDFPPGYIPVVADPAHAQYLFQFGGTLIRSYAQSIWLRPGFGQWYDHVEKIYARVSKSGKNKGLGSGTPPLPQEVIHA